MADHRAEQPNDSMRLAFEGTLGPATWAVIHWLLFTSDGTPTFAQLNAMVDSIAALFGQHFIHNTAHSNDLHFTTVKCRYRLQAGPEVYRTTRIADVVGIGGADREAAQVAALCNFVTADARRGGKPRSYIPGLVGSALQDSCRLTAVQLAALSEGANDYLTALPTLSSGPLLTPSLVDMSFRDAKTWRTTPHAYPILAAAYSPEVATQRRRVDRLRT